MEPRNTASAAPAEEGKNYLSAEDIFAADDIDFVEVEIPEWKRDGKPGTIRLRAMNASEAIKFGEEVKDKAKLAESYVRIVALTAVKVNPDGTCGDPLFVGDVAVHNLRKKKNAVFMRLQKAAMKLNFPDDAKEEAKKD
jgi:hypothetical protein